MNAAARLFNQGQLSRSWVISLFLTRFQFWAGALIFVVLFSALSLVYVTNVSRSLRALQAQQSSEADHLHVQWGQFLLEKSSLTRQARLQEIAVEKLQMVMPDSHHQAIIILKSQKNQNQNQKKDD